MNLARFPRVRLAHAPTPLEPMDALSRHLGGPRLWIKRDDCTGLSTGGNKTRKLEYLMADAKRLGADVVITQGATQSNHARQTAAAAAKLGLACHVLLEDRVGFDNPAYRDSGNVLLDNLHGATVHRYAAGAEMTLEIDAVVADLTARGQRPYFIPTGGSNPIGALGYANCALELMAQANEFELRVDHIVHASGSAGTQAGLVAGLVALNAGIPVLGVSVSAPKDVLEERVFALTEQTLELIGAPRLLRREQIVADSDYIGQGYGLPTEAMIDAVKLVAQREGVLLDPVYSGKAMAGLIALIRQGRFKEDDNVVFLHTGGSVGLFAYSSIF